MAEPRPRYVITLGDQTEPSVRILDRDPIALKARALLDALYTAGATCSEHNVKTAIASWYCGDSPRFWVEDDADHEAAGALLHELDALAEAVGWEAPNE